MLDRLRSLARTRARELAIDDGSERTSFAELLARAEQLASSLTPGAVVASVLPNGRDATAVALAALEAGAVSLPLPAKATVHELAQAFSLHLPDAVIALRGALPTVLEALAALSGMAGAPAQVPRVRLIEPEAELEPGATPAALRHANIPLERWGELATPIEPHATLLPASGAILQLTSGSTGRPKGVVLERAAIEAGIDQNADFGARFAGRAVFSPMPQFHAMGGAVVLEHLLAGSSVLVSNKFVPGEDRKRMQQAKCALLVGAPSYFRILIQLGMWKNDALPDLEAGALGSAASDPGLLAALREAAPRMSLHLRYGLSEAFGALTRLDIEPGDALPPRGLVGTGLPGVQLALRTDEPAAGDDAVLDRDPDAGAEIRARTNAAARAILVAAGQLVELSDAEGFLSTGDFGVLDARGLHLRGRKSEFIKRQGYRIEPGEIEQVLVRAPSVREAVVVGLPDPVAGARIVALVECGSGEGGSGEGGSDDPKALLEHCRKHLSAHKIPQRIECTDALPRTPSGKPDRRAVRALLEASQSDE